MDYMSLLKSLADKAGQNLDQAGSNQKTVMNQSLDRMKMNNPDLQGPRLPDVTPQEKDFYNNISGGVMGSVAPLSNTIAPLAAQTAREGVANMLAKSAANGEMGVTQNMLARAQNAMSRSVDQADRFKNQFSKIKNMVRGTK